MWLVALLARSRQPAAGSPDRISVCAGTLDLPTGLRTTRAWWVSEAGDYHDRPDLTELHTEG